MSVMLYPCILCVAIHNIPSTGVLMKSNGCHSWRQPHEWDAV